MLYIYLAVVCGIKDRFGKKDNRDSITSHAFSTDTGPSPFITAVGGADVGSWWIPPKTNHT